jgi:hypothetical protein
MRTALDANPAQLDRHERNFVKKIREHGWFGTYVGSEDDRPCFGYTTGFWLKFRIPELIVFSLRRHIAHDMFWHMYHRLEAGKLGKRFTIGEPDDDIFQNVVAVLFPVSPQEYQAHLGWSRWFYGGDEFQCLQVVFPDSNGCFPWSSRASDSFRASQPDLTIGNWFGHRGH